jgi:lysophospholipase L1-like esterase
MRLFRLAICAAAVVFGSYFWLAHWIPWQNDFAQLNRYHDANKRLTPQQHRVVFLGDSITAFWDLAKYFPGRPYVNRGIAGQTTSQILLRFEQDVVSLQPEEVVILAGTNDIARNIGETEVEANYRAIAELSSANGIKVVFASLLPVHNYTFDSALMSRPMEKITALNTWLKQYSKANRFIYLDYFSAMVDERGLLKKEFSSDGLHPNAEGYRVMAILAGSVLATSSTSDVHDDQPQ